MLLKLLRNTFATRSGRRRADAARALALAREAEQDPNRSADAIDALEGVLADEPQALDVRFALAQALERGKSLTAAIDHYRMLLEADPQQALVHNRLANCLARLGRISEAAPHYRRTAELRPDFLEAHTSVLGCLNYDPDIGPDGVFAEHRTRGARFSMLATDPAPHENDRDPSRRLRIGYVSPDLKRHPVTYLFAPTLARHDASKFEIFCYHNQSSADAVTARLKTMAHGWRDIAGMSDDEACSQIRSDRIDVLVDLAGHTTHGRLSMFARRPAPVQVSWLGYFNTTGIDAIDYFITDVHSSPPGQERWYVERLVRLPDTRFCYEPPDYAPQVAPLPATTRGFVTFGCFNTLSKLNARVLSLWGRVLAAVPGSRLELISIGLHDEDNAKRMTALCASHGISSDRLGLRAFLSHPQLLAAYSGIDIALDPFPFCGGLTSLEALWMGVPVVTLDQPTIAGRQTLCFLRNLKLDALVAGNEAEYVAIASRLPSNTDALAALRGELRARMSDSPLLDAATFTSHLEDAYRQVWREWVGALPVRESAQAPLT